MKIVPSVRHHDWFIFALKQQTPVSLRLTFPKIKPPTDICTMIHIYMSEVNNGITNLQIRTIILLFLLESHRFALILKPKRLPLRA